MQKSAVHLVGLGGMILKPMHSLTIENYVFFEIVKQYSIAYPYFLCKTFFGVLFKFNVSQLNFCLKTTIKQ